MMHSMTWRKSRSDVDSRLGEFVPGSIDHQRVPLCRLALFAVTRFLSSCTIGSAEPHECGHVGQEPNGHWITAEKSNHELHTTQHAAIRFLRFRLSRSRGVAAATDRSSHDSECPRRANNHRYPARAKRVIFLCMSGGPAQLDTFDYKPQTGNKKHPGSVFKFNQHGESGLWISELLPETAKHADRLCVINGMHADTGNHAQSFLQLHTGERLRKRPSMGSWITYGLGTENENLPGFISLNAAKPSVYSSEFLPTVFEGTPIGVNGENMSLATISNISGEHLPLTAKRKQLDFVQAMNREHLADRPDDAKLEGVIESMELAFRMQATAPELLDLS